MPFRVGAAGSFCGSGLFFPLQGTSAQVLPWEPLPTRTTTHRASRPSGTLRIHPAFSSWTEPGSAPGTCRTPGPASSEEASDAAHLVLSSVYRAVIPHVHDAGLRFPRIVPHSPGSGQSAAPAAAVRQLLAAGAGRLPRGLGHDQVNEHQLCEVPANLDHHHHANN